MFTADCALDWTGKAVTIASGATLTSNGNNVEIVAHSLNAIGNINLDGVYGGNLTITADGDISIEGDITSNGDVSSDDVDGSGGAITIVAGGGLSVFGDIDSSGDSIEYIYFDEDFPEDTETQVVTGTGGDIKLTGHHVLVAGDLIAKGAADDGGAVTITATNDYATVAGDVITDAMRYFDDGIDGGAVEIGASGAVNISGKISTTGIRSAAGDVEIESIEGDVVVSNSISANGSGVESIGGDIAIEAARNIVISDTIEAVGAGGASNEDDNAQPGNILVAVTELGSIAVAPGARLRATGVQNDGFSGVIEIGPACDIVIDGTIDTLGGQGEGSNFVSYRNTLSGNGKLFAAETEDSGNFIECRSNGGGSCFTPPATLSCSMGVCTSAGLRVQPDALLEAASLPSCSAGCGNSVQEVGEECDDGNTVACDGCSPSCTLQGTGSPCGATACQSGGNCTAPGTCTGASPVVCNDGNACTSDSTCSTTTGCTYTPIVCDDSNSDTVDTCDAAIGCVYTPRPIIVPLKAPELLAILTELLDPCMGADATACKLGATTCTALTAATKQKLSFVKLLPPLGDERLTLGGRGTFGSLVPSLDFVAKGLRVLISDPSSSPTRHPIVDVVLPPGALGPSGRGWTVGASSSATKWKYADRTPSPVGGITQMSLALTHSSGMLKFSIKGRGLYDLTESTLPLTAILVLDPTAEATDQCTQLSFTPSPRLCRFSGSGSGLKCK